MLQRWVLLLLQLAAVSFAGSFSGSTVFNTNTGSPGVKDFADVSFTPATEIPVGGSIEIVMPQLTGVQSGWSFESPAASWTTPSTGAATAQSTTWVPSTRTLTIVAATNAIAGSAPQVLRITNARTPSSVVAANTATITSVSGATLDSGSLTIAEITAGALSSATFATATDTPGFESLATVTFTTAGRVETGGKVVLVMPAESGAQHSWRFTDGGSPSTETSGTSNAPTIAFTTPSSSTPTASSVGYTLGTRTLIFTVGANDLAQATQHVFTITNALTPSSVVGVNNVVATTQDSADKDVDTTSSMLTDQIVVGALSSATFATATDTPGFESLATVTFTTAGRVETGGKGVLVMPAESGAQHGWRFTDGGSPSAETSGTSNAPTVAFTAPSSSTPTASSVGCTLVTRTLTRTLIFT